MGAAASWLNATAAADQSISSQSAPAATACLPSVNNTALTAEQSSENGSYPATWYWQQPPASKSQQPSEQGPTTTIVSAAAGTPTSTAATGIQPAKEVVRIRHLRST